MGTKRHQIRELAIQALYQLDARGDEADEHIEQSIGGAPHAEPAKAEALQLARAAWASHERADALTNELAPAWPTKRQPPVDRSIIRLGYHELAGGQTPAAVVLNEAVELAKEYGSERSPAFVNGVLDKIAKRLSPAPGSNPAPAPAPGSETTPASKTDAQPENADTGDPFLDDALKNARRTE